MNGRKLTPLVLLFFTFSLFTACKNLALPKDTPSCIKKEIRRIKSDPVRNPPSTVWEYNYNGQTVYYVPPYCCDMQGQLFDNRCSLICSPDGGITGKGDGKCSDFFSNRTNEKLIWKDER